MTLKWSPQEVTYVPTVLKKIKLLSQRAVGCKYNPSSMPSKWTYMDCLPLFITCYIYPLFGFLLAILHSQYCLQSRLILSATIGCLAWPSTFYHTSTTLNKIPLVLEQIEHAYFCDTPAGGPGFFGCLSASFTYTAEEGQYVRRISDISYSCPTGDRHNRFRSGSSLRANPKSGFRSRKLMPKVAGHLDAGCLLKAA
jgi:hypothetical protein